MGWGVVPRKTSCDGLANKKIVAEAARVQLIREKPSIAEGGNFKFKFSAAYI